MVRVVVFLIIPNEYERFLEGNYSVMSYSVLLKTVSTPPSLQPPRYPAELYQKGDRQPISCVDHEAVEYAGRMGCDKLKQ